MANPQNPAQKSNTSYQAGKDNKTQSEKEKHDAAKKHEAQKNTSDKPSNKSGH